MTQTGSPTVDSDCKQTNYMITTTKGTQTCILGLNTLCLTNIKGSVSSGDVVFCPSFTEICEVFLLSTIRNPRGHQPIRDETRVTCHNTRSAQKSPQRARRTAGFSRHVRSSGQRRCITKKRQSLFGPI